MLCENLGAKADIGCHSPVAALQSTNG